LFSNHDLKRRIREKRKKEKKKRRKKNKKRKNKKKKEKKGTTRKSTSGLRLWTSSAIFKRAVVDELFYELSELLSC